MQAVRPKVKTDSEPPKKQYEYSGQYKTAGAYADALRSWMVQLYQVQCIHNSFPLFLANLQAQSLSGTSRVQTSQPQSQQAQSTQQQQQTQNAQQRVQEVPRPGVEYVIPPIWKRFAAEVIDFVLLFVIKLGFTYVAVDTFDLDDDFEALSTDILSDYKTALSITSDILLLELIHRIGTCIFEALCLHRGPRGIGGATPGKRFMGLRVVRCDFVAPGVAERVYVYPSSDLGLGRAVVRSVVKNFSLTFLFPICFTMFSFQHNRTIYDIMAGSIVVEERPPPPRPANNNNN